VTNGLISQHDWPISVNNSTTARFVSYWEPGSQIPFGLPGWEQLIARLYAGHEPDRPSGIDLKRQAEFFKTRFCSGDDSVFIEHVKRSLYPSGPPAFEALRRNDTLGAIGALVMNSVRGRASTVINFNFDDLLEAFLEFHGFVVHSIGEERFWTRAADIEILHPHGLVPAYDVRDASRRIVLDQREYSRIVGDDSNPWRQRLLAAMRSKTCLFIGTSGTDDNMDSLIGRVHESHAAADAGTAYWGVWLTAGADAANQQLWESRGVFPLVLPDFAVSLPSELMAMAQQAAKQRSS
jgi:hypothetical protein